MKKKHIMPKHLLPNSVNSQINRNELRFIAQWFPIPIEDDSVDSESRQICLWMSKDNERVHIYERGQDSLLVLNRETITHIKSAIERRLVE